MSKILIDNDEEGDDGIGIPDVEAVNRLHLAVDATVNDTIDELARLRAVNQELVTALKHAHKLLINGDAMDGCDKCVALGQLALQHAETRTP